MRIVVLDTETTGIGPTDEVIQISTICLDEKLNIINASNDYCKISMPVPAEATAVHGITNKTLEELSGNKYLEDHVAELDYLCDAKDTIFIGYNIAFDIEKINYSLTNAGYPPIDFGVNVNTIPKETRGNNYNICLMKSLKSYLDYPGRWRKLSAMYKTYVDIPDQVVLNLKDEIVRLSGICPGHGADNYHDALYDTLITTLLFNNFIHFYRI